MKKYEDYDQLDQMFFDEILEIIRKKYGGNPRNMMDSSTFFMRYEEDPLFIQHYPSVYWADFIYDQHVNRSRLDA